MSEEYQEKNLYTTQQKLELFGHGEWTKEPDEVLFEFLGYKCRLWRNKLGVWCGYVRIPSGHPWWELNYKEIECDCHGGLTYGGRDDTEGYWIGIDCNHRMDINPLNLVMCKELAKHSTEGQQISVALDLLRNFGNRGNKPAYRNMQYCIEQCKQIVAQAIKVTNDNET